MNEVDASGVPVSSIQGARPERGAVPNEGGVQRIRKNGGVIARLQQRLYGVVKMLSSGSFPIVLWSTSSMLVAILYTEIFPRPSFPLSGKCGAVVVK